MRGDSDKGGQTTRRLQLISRRAIIAWSHKSEPTLREEKLEEAIEDWQSFCNCDEPGAKLEKNQSLGPFCSCCAPFTCCTDCNVHVVDQTLWSQFSWKGRVICFPICFTQSPWMAHFHQCDLVWWTASCLGDFFYCIQNSLLRKLWNRKRSSEVSFVSTTVMFLEAHISLLFPFVACSCLQEA